MANGIQFEGFTLDAADRQLRQGGVPVELSSRYFDALALLVAERGRLVTKDRFLGEVWRGVPVTDEALTQCIRTLRRQLGDDAARPRFIETVPKHGYRFIAPVADGATEVPKPFVRGPSEFAQLAAAGIAGSAVAGIAGGLFYGFAAAGDTLAGGAGAVSILLVMLALTMFVALLGGAGVSLGVAAAQQWRREEWWASAGFAALGGMIVGALVKLIAIDSVNLLFGRAPLGVTGGIEGAVLGGAIGLAAWLCLREGRAISLRRTIGVAGLFGAAAGAGIVALGGHLLGGSLDLLGHEFDGSKLDLAPIGRLFGEAGFGPLGKTVTGLLEGGLFAACLVGGMAMVRSRNAAREA